MALASLSAAGPRLAARRPALPLPRATTTQRRSPPQRQRIVASGGHTPPAAGGGGCVGAKPRARDTPERPTAPEPPASPAAEADEDDAISRRCLSLAFHLMAGGSVACAAIMVAGLCGDVSGWRVARAVGVSLVWVWMAARQVEKELRSDPVREVGRPPGAGDIGGLIGGLALCSSALLTAVTQSALATLCPPLICAAYAGVAYAWPRHRKLLAVTALYALPCLVCLGTGFSVAAKMRLAQQQQTPRL
ncbi:hypothetical protein HYH03_002089 [Edaphochlamys debaryana]|uniref:Uncharacterized protein n=1 Tax=Edaphochlamys debaryana TaxID=47281 RepID=A0A835YDV6_9CHLO|nr:hypothetical protein HYH03_002089 [Edaphochlamys debaryana]|eukprot:KAG2499792.1 hypothetical protein HYH03_002089 [Edaphochlamys debaryana]